MGRPMKLATIAVEAKACRAAWAAAPDAIYAWHCHHEALAEPLTGPAGWRIAYILRNKPKHERALRLHLFRPVRNVAALAPARTAYHAALASAWTAYAAACASAGTAYDAALTSARTAYVAARASAGTAYDAARAPAHAAECDPGCPWDGQTIVEF